MYGKVIHDLRKERGLTQFQLAKVFKVDNTTISVWELEKAEPSIPQIIKICEYFCISSDELLGIEDESGRKNINN